MTQIQGNIEYRFFSTRFGDCLIARSEQGICALEFLSGGRAPALQRLESDYTGSTFSEGGPELASLAESVFEPANDAHPDVDLSGTDFQLAVWKALRQIPPGTTVSYRSVAESIGRPRAIRAVASAIASNRLAYLVPCHRVVRSNGALGGYRWGVDLKSALLNWELSEYAEPETQH